MLIITTSKSPESTWEGRSEEDIAQLLRRITYVRDFGRYPYDDVDEREHGSMRQFVEQPLEFNPGF
jgi:hypothetical protein